VCVCLRERRRDRVCVCMCVKERDSVCESKRGRVSVCVCVFASVFIFLCVSIDNFFRMMVWKAKKYLSVSSFKCISISGICVCWCVWVYVGERVCVCECLRMCVVSVCG